LDALRLRLLQAQDPVRADFAAVDRWLAGVADRLAL